MLPSSDMTPADDFNGYVKLKTAHDPKYGGRTWNADESECRFWLGMQQMLFACLTVRAQHPPNALAGLKWSCFCLALGELR